MMKFLRLLLLFSAVIFIYSCSKKSEAVSSNTDTQKDTIADDYQQGFESEGEMMDVNFDPTLIGAFSPQTKKKIELDSISYFFNQYKELADLKDDINQFYTERDSAFAWFDENGLTEQADHLAVKLMNLEKDGKEEKIVYHNQFHQMMDNVVEKKDEEKVELMLTSQYLLYSKRKFEGKAAQLASAANWLKPRQKFDALEAIKKSETNNGKIFDEEPVHQHYIALKNKMLDFHKKGFDTVNSKIPAGTYKLGDSSATVAKIRERLVFFGDLKNAAKSGEFDKEMLDAVHSFQHRNGLDSANIGKQTIEKLNVSGRDLLEKMFVNLERMRWMSPEEGQYLFVNIPAFKLFAYDDAQKYLWDMNVIVGKTNHRTVVFSDKMTYVDFAPYWNIPPGIMKNKIMPAMKRSGSYLARNHMEKTKGWAAKGIPAVRQKPGPWNSLGKVKFMFPNTYNIYLHDTNERYLFKNQDRNYSSGCVRVEDPFKLAKFVLKDNKDIDDSLIIKRMDSTKENRVVLAKKMPVHLAYFTTFVDSNGNLVISKDIYKRDEKLKKMMMINAVQPSNSNSVTKNPVKKDSSKTVVKKSA